jgi:nucleoside-diphosphate kinase
MMREGPESIAVVRKMIGSTEPKSSLPGTIRGDYSLASYGYVNDK